MKLLGLDFDNTLVHYDHLFHELAKEKKLIGDSGPRTKSGIRDYLKQRNEENEFTILQGEVYGLHILRASPAEGMLDALKEISNMGIDMCIVSHKTRTPYKGPQYDLHKAAWNWLEKHGFFSQEGLNWSRDQVFFEETKDAKINRISTLKCNFYVDDLPEILKSLPVELKKIHYDPFRSNNCNELTTMKRWCELKNLLG